MNSDYQTEEIKQEQLAKHFICHFRGLAEPALRRRVELPCTSKCLFEVELEAEGGEGKVVVRGLCPYGSMLGDWVVVLFGGRVPYLLREKRLRREQKMKAKSHWNGCLSGSVI
jgi:hypothetical protein